MFPRIQPPSLLAALIAVGDLAAAVPVDSLASLDVRDMPRPRFGNVPYGVDITTCTVKGKVALSFDDGPGEYTAKVLDTLEKNGNIKATFFLVGSSPNGKTGISNAAYASVLKRMFNAGHQLGSHSWSHQNFDAISQQQMREEVLKNEDIFSKTFGVIPTYWRPPYTHCSAPCISVLNEYAYHITDFNLDTRDWQDGGVNAKQIYSGIIKASNPTTDKWISLAHDIHPFTADGFVQYMIDVAKEKGYQFTTIGDCLGDPSSNWYRDPKTGGPWSGLNDNSKPSTTIKSESSTKLESSTKVEATSKSQAPTTTSSSTTSSSTLLQTTKTSVAVSSSVDSRGTQTASTMSATTSTTTTRPPVTSAAAESANMSLEPVHSTTTTSASTVSSTSAKPNFADRTVFSVSGVFAGLIAWSAMMLV
ncbi:unnamed protein product [Clonostachys rosea f. rosea IK726]|uniref:NodB homology domain-containing protein n=2 Tax=Bionectria ochroleuca TaxID=29856 RepID=A0A0B7KH57_BIOOC|nr:unnamed protein product [Clonostachys rosea f. rosea IK726]